MEKTYNPLTLEPQWYATWEQRGYFLPSGHGTPYCIMLPPPNITGSLHLGHGFQHTLMDALIRYHRMCGDNTLWQPGTDHASISTQMVVERQLETLGKSRHDLGREAFIERVWEWKEESGGTISRQMRRMGFSPDWSRERFTLEPDLSHAVEKVFVRLYDEGLIYRGKRLINWDPKLCTAVSDLEVISTEEKGSLWHIRYPLADGSGHIIVATTRPETMLGDVAVAVHPEDPRYTSLIGKMVALPLTDRTLPIITDPMVDPTFGSGCVKITPAHDFNDYATAQRHALPMINIFTPKMLLNEQAPAAYQGLDRFKARKKIVEDLTQAGLVEKIDDHMLAIPRGEKSGEILEPYLTHQWFVKIKSLAEPAIAAVERGEIRFIPDSWTKTYFQWMYNIEDWCISRQLWWGHRIPAWYDEQGKIYVGHTEKHVREKYHLDTTLTLTQDEDVLDTWFSSALWPFTTLGWPQSTPELKTFYPTQVLITGFDIIFFWVARMIMMGLKFTGKVPFREVYITALIRDAEGQKMSKTKGNVLDPIDIIDGISLDALLKKRTYGLMQPAIAKKIETATRKQFPQGIASYGTDALRYTYCALATPGRDIRFDLGRVGGYRNFCNKLWNAARYVFLSVEKAGYTSESVISSDALSPADRWILSKLQETIATTHEHYQHYRFDLLAQSLYEFTWHEFCDWYVELSKPANLAACHTLITVLENLLRLLHPLIPFITEEIWQGIAPLARKQGETIMLQPYPVVDRALIDHETVENIEWLKRIVTLLRIFRSERNIPPSKTLPITFRGGASSDHARREKYAVLLQKLAQVEEKESASADAITLLAGKLEILVSLASVIDPAAEKARQQKEKEKLEREYHSLVQKLSNPDYCARAPQAIVEKDRQRKAELEGMLNLR